MTDDEPDLENLTFAKVALSMPAEATATRLLLALIPEHTLEDGNYLIPNVTFFETVSTAVAILELRLIEIEKKLAAG